MIEIVNKKEARGFTLIEILVDFAIVALVATAVISAYMAGFKAIALAKAKITAVSLANEKMEILRNLSYDDLATANGTIYPPGEILDEEAVIRDGINFMVNTIITYVDDPFDGNIDGTIPGKPQDIYPYDYKKLEIVVRKVNATGNLAKLTTNVSAKAAETPSDTGIFYFCVIDAAGLPVPDATVTLTNTEVEPPVNMEFTVGVDGCRMIPMLPPDEHNHYHVVVTKDGYSTDMTYPRTSQNPNEEQPDIDISSQQVTRLTLTIDKKSILNLRFVDMSGNSVPNLNFNLESSKLIYFNPATYKYSEDFSADESGNITINDLEFDRYKVTILTSGYYLSSISEMHPISLEPDNNITAVITVSSSASNPMIATFSPDSITTNSNLILDITGDNFDNGATVKIRNGEGTEIFGTNIDRQSDRSISADFDLTGVSTGNWDICVTNPSGENVWQSPGINILP